MVHFFLEQGSLSSLVVVVIICLLLATVGYFLAFRNLKAGQWQLLLFLRVIAIVMIILLLFRPAISYHKDLQEKPSLIFLIDRSGR